jgi:hypothetical protein
LSDIISSALPSQSLLGKDGKMNEYFSKVLQNGATENGSSESVESSSISSNTNDSHNRAPGSQLHNKGMNKSLGHSMNNGSAITSLQNAIINNSNNSNLISNAFQDFSPDVSKQILAIDSDSMLSPMEKEQRKRLCLYGICKLTHNSKILLITNAFLNLNLKHNLIWIIQCLLEYHLEF